MAEPTQVLEINLISAQGLNRHKKTYAVAWINSSTKLRTQIDRVGGENPTWNDKFLFKVSPEFLSGETSAFSVEIYSAGTIFRKKLIGTVRILISSFLPTARTSPAFAAFLIRGPSGKFSGILNVGAIVQNTFSCFRALSKVSGIDYRDLAGEKLDGKRCVISSRNKSKAIVGDMPICCSDSSVHEPDGGDSLISVLLKQSVENDSKKSWINLGQKGIWRYSINVLRFKMTFLEFHIAKVNCKFNLWNLNHKKYPPYGRRAPVAIESNVLWERLRAPQISTSPHDLHISDCLNELHPGDHIEIQWRRNKKNFLMVGGTV